MENLSVMKQKVSVIHGTEMSPGREQNQDAYRIYLEQPQVAASGRGAIFALGDGLGGYRGGGDASKMAVDQLWLYYQVPTPQFRPRDTLLWLFQKANTALYKMGQENESHRRMGSTLSVILFDPTFRHFMVVQVGDSPIFMRREKVWKKLSEDHVEEGTNRLTQRLGRAEPLEPHMLTGDVRPGDRFLLVSDGLWTVTSPTDLLDGADQADSPQAFVDEMLKRIREEGGDNGTMILVDIPGAGQVS